MKTDIGLSFKTESQKEYTMMSVNSGPLWEGTMEEYQ